MRTINYTVEGRWPFPLDMLRRDNAKPRTEADARLIEALSGDMVEGVTPRGRVQVGLVMETPNRFSGPLISRWKSFGWKVVKSDDGLVSEPPAITVSEPYDTVSVAELNRLRNRSMKLDFLERGGVEKWDGYEKALQGYEEFFR